MKSSTTNPIVTSNILALCLSLLAALWLLPAAANQTGLEQVRHKYRHIDMLSAEQLKTRFSGSVIVDVRSEFEYQVIHINNARNMPLNSTTFIHDLQALRQANPAKTIVFYCNGPQCEKSYKAVEQARQHNIVNVAALDAGINGWAESYPDSTTFLGKSPMDPAQRLAGEQLSRHMLDPENFVLKIQEGNSILVDVRDVTEAAGMALFPMQQKHAGLSRSDIHNLIRDAKQNTRTMLIYDSSGTTVQWLQYMLEAEGVTNYWFLKGGADAYLNL